MASVAVNLTLVHPSQGVSLGDNVTLRCHLPRLAAWVWLYQERGWSYNQGKEKEQDAAEFSFVSTLQEHAGRYRCQYRVPWSVGASEKSDPVELVLTDHSYSPPSISIHPEQGVEMGTNITIRCWNKDYGATFLLHKDGSSDPIKHQDPSGGGAAKFTFLAVTPADSGTYRCSYRPRGYPFVSSPRGDSVMLEVTPTAALSVGSEPPICMPPVMDGWLRVCIQSAWGLWLATGTPKHLDPRGAVEQSCANLVMALVRGFVAALVFGLGVFFVIDARSLWIRRDDNCGAPPPVTVSV
ncbi:platelet glycoprotein VI-like [Gallus gallus]|uniref:platelet glycoprotein VI-like n=1 Tax=Gallus gallus TaxID=9031 RepID=UPI001AE56FCF|nr:platelet glycoprotein VI-like [Gallus gallus]